MFLPSSAFLLFSRRNCFRLRHAVFDLFSCKVDKSTTEVDEGEQKMFRAQQFDKL